MKIKSKKNKEKKIVFVGMSGGVDSSVSAAILQKEGHEVVGVFMRTWHPDFIKCNEEEERLDAMRVAAYLGIPFLTFDLEEEYKKGVADYMISGYKAGRTPNPDVMCNKEVKFGSFLTKAISMGADYVATGHYAQKKLVLSNFPREYPASPRHYSQNNLIPVFSLNKANDPSKDQSYFLWTLDQERLAKILYPIGHLKKTEVRKLATKFGLPVAEKKDSQGICFLGDIDLKDFLKHYIKEKRGKVMLASQKEWNEQGKEIGYHDGVVFHTLGERHGFTITQKGPNDGAYYVVGKDIKKNILIVSQDKKVQTVNSINNIKLEKVNWISGTPKENTNHTAQIRYHGEFLPCQIFCGSLASAEVVFKNPVLVAPGQSVVVYDKDVVLGGGVVV